MISQHADNKSLIRIFCAILMVHGCLLLIQQAEENLKDSRPVWTVQLTKFGSDAPFVAGTPVARPVKAKPRVSKSVFAPKSISQTLQEKAPLETTSTNASAGSGGVASEFNSAGSMARADLQQIYLSELRARIEEMKHYPLQARRLGQSGSVEVAFVVKPDGVIENPRIIRPSPFKRLNESALETVASLRKFRPLPKDFGTNPLQVTLPINYSIRN